LIDDKSFVSVGVTNDMYLYRSKYDTLVKITPEQLPGILAQRPLELRHWVQLFKGSWLETAIIKLSPR
jgi:hypothetical protein